MKIELRKSDNGAEMKFNETWVTIDFDNLDKLIDYILENKLKSVDIEIDANEELENYQSLLNKIFHEIEKSDFLDAYQKVLSSRDQG